MDTNQFTKNGKYLMLALDHRGSLKKMMNPQNPDAVRDEEVVELKRQIIDALKDQFTGVLVDPQFGLKALTVKKPYLLCIEKTGYIEDGGGRVTELEYTVEDLKKMNASGVKILLYFNPDDKSAIKQLDTAKQVLADCIKQDLPLFLEIVTYGDKPKSELITRSLENFLQNNIRPQVFKLEYPGDAEACQKVTSLLGETPWILLTRGDNYERFKENLKIAAQNGCRGFLAGRSIWQEAASLKGNVRELFLKDKMLKRFKEISEIV